MQVVADFHEPVRGTNRMDGAYDKIWVRMGGVPMPLRLLSPYLSFEEETFEQCRAIMLDRHPDWLKQEDC
jgi:hypothetical protein